MSGERLANRQARVTLLIEALRQTYPDAHCELNYRTPLQLLVATILSAQTTDKQVNLVTPELFRKYRSARDYARANPASFANDIRRIGLYRNKAKNIQAACRALVARHGGRVPHTMEALVALDGVGRKTANVVLGNAFGIGVGIVVDTHVVRLSGRLGLTGERMPEKIEQDLMRLVPPEHWIQISHWLIWHGRRRCLARKPQCESCELAAWCPRRGVSPRSNATTLLPSARRARHATKSTKASA